MRILTLSYGDYCAKILPSCGGSILSFAYKAREHLRGTQGDASSPLEASHFPCTPYFGRLYGDLHFHGQRWGKLRPTLSEASDLPLHGHGWVSKWDVISKSNRSAQLRHDFTPNDPGDFPFAYRATQTISVDEHGLTITLEVENSGTVSMPAGLGLHPFFQRTPETLLQFTAKEFWFPPLEDSDGILGPLPTRLGTSLSAPLGERLLDHSFAGFGGELVITDKEKTLRLSSDAPVLHIYTPEGEDFFCAEPVSHLPGRLTEQHSAFGGETLAPGETTALTMTISATD